MHQLAEDIPPGHDHQGAGHEHRLDAAGSAPHGHLHGAADPVYLSTARGMWAIKWSFAILGAGALLQLAVAMLSGSVALLADMIHNLADAGTAVPLAVAFLAMARPPTMRFTHGYGRLEDLAGVAIVLVILASAIAVGYEAAHRLMNPQPVAMLLAVAAAALIGFAANESVAMLRIGVGREIHSAALIADGHHARADGLASLAVAAGAGMVKLGYPIADPLIALAIAVMIVAIVWQSAATVFTRMLDGVEPAIVGEIRDAASRVPGVIEVRGIRARWLGHRLVAEAEIAVDSALTVREALAIADQFEAAALEHLPAPAAIRVAIARKEEFAS
jgi:cation diffusion facilitator family transporter